MLEALDRSVVDTSGNVVTKKTHGKTVFGTSFGAAVGTRAFNSGRWAIKWRLQRVTEANGDGIIIGVTDADFESSGKAWGFAPATGRLSTTRNVAVPSAAGTTLACGGLRGGSAAGATVTLVVDMSRRALAVALNGGPPCEAAVRLPRAVRAWILLQHLGDAVALVGCDELPPDAGKPRAPPSSKGKRDESSPRHPAKRGDAPRPDRLSRATTSLSDDRYADGRRSAPHSVVGSTSSVRSVGSVGSPPLDRFSSPDSYSHAPLLMN